MISLVEGDLRLELPNSINGRVFDDDDHGLSHCMSAVDWIFDLDEETYFVEIEDPDAPAAGTHDQRNEFAQRFLSGRLDKDLVRKFRDTFLYEWACKRVDKPILYVVIVASGALDPALLSARTDELKRNLPSGTPCSWARPIAKSCLVVNMKTWNQNFPKFRLSRISEGA